mmetsp:Transcript_4857/g.8610  ORF Transcript_4857/g.8610 Transcript_4857/m.8610 type:complete len:241 (-) Transcript_4857:142-864(-)
MGGHKPATHRPVLGLGQTPGTQGTRSGDLPPVAFPFSSPAIARTRPRPSVPDPSFCVVPRAGFHLIGKKGLVTFRDAAPPSGAVGMARRARANHNGNRHRVAQRGRVSMDFKNDLCLRSGVNHELSCHEYSITSCDALVGGGGHILKQDDSNDRRPDRHAYALVRPLQGLPEGVDRLDPEVKGSSRTHRLSGLNDKALRIRCQEMFVLPQVLHFLHNSLCDIFRTASSSTNTLPRVPEDA